VKTTISASDGIVKESREKLFAELRISAEKKSGSSWVIVNWIAGSPGKIISRPAAAQGLYFSLEYQFVDGVKTYHWAAHFL